MRVPTREQAQYAQPPAHNVVEVSHEREARSHQAARASRTAAKSRLSFKKNVFIRVDPLVYQCQHPKWSIRTIPNINQITYSVVAELFHNLVDGGNQSPESGASHVGASFRVTWTV